MSEPVQKLMIQAVRELGIDRPVYVARVVGERLELHLYGGEVVSWPLPAHAASSGGAGDLSRLRLAELRELARRENVPHWNRLRKAELLAALQQRRDTAG